jgi:hypothetical protein
MLTQVAGLFYDVKFPQEAASVILQLHPQPPRVTLASGLSSFCLHTSRNRKLIFS